MMDKTFILSNYVIIYFIGIVFTIISALIGYMLSTTIKGFDYKTKNCSYFYLLFFFTIVYAVIFSIMKDLSVLSHHSYFDFAVFLDYFNNFIQGKGLISTLQESYYPGRGHWFSSHFTPIIYFFAFAYKISPSFHTINWSQTILMAISPLILYCLSRRFIGAFGSFCIALALLFNPTFQYITLYEFEYFRFIVPVGILALGITLGHYSILYIFLSSLAVLFIREDAALMVFGIGAFVFLFQKDRRKLGVVLMTMAIVYLVILLQVIMPLFRGASVSENAHVAAYWFYEFGETPYEIVKNILLNPAKFIAYLFHPFKLFNWVMYILPFAFLPLAGADVLVVMLPTLAVLSYSSSVTHTSYFLYYVAPILVAMIWATIVGIPRLVRFASEKERLKKWLRRCPPAVERFSFAVLIGSIACSIYFGPSPISIQFWFRDFSLAPFHSTTFYVERYRPTSHDEIVRKAANMIPVSASVSAEFFLLVDIYRSRGIRVFPSIEDVDYVFIDKSHPRKTRSSGGPFKVNLQFYYKWIENRPDVFELVYAVDGVFLYKRRPNAPSYLQPHAPN